VPVRRESETPDIPSFGSKIDVNNQHCMLLRPVLSLDCGATDVTRRKERKEDRSSKSNSWPCRSSSG
jgi:hypothetical protein